MEREKIKEDYEELMRLIDYLTELLADDGKRFEVIRKELQEVKDKFGDKRKTEITYLDNEVSIKDLIREEDVVITISHLRYIKRTSATEYRQQRREGRGADGRPDEGGELYRAFVCSFHASYDVVLYRKGALLLAECL